MSPRWSAPVDEPVADTLRAAIAGMTEAGWTDRAEGAGVTGMAILDRLPSGEL